MNFDSCTYQWTSPQSRYGIFPSSSKSPCAPFQFIFSFAPGQRQLPICILSLQINLHFTWMGSYWMYYFGLDLSFKILFWNSFMLLHFSIVYSFLSLSSFLSYCTFFFFLNSPVSTIWFASTLGLFWLKLL